MQLEAKEHDVARAEAEFEQLRDEVSSILSRFNPALDSLVQETSVKFSAAFERIGCTGEVRVSRVQGNYAEWGMEILVSYRDGQDLEVLTASRQSGGVSTGIASPPSLTLPGALPRHCNLPHESL